MLVLAVNFKSRIESSVWAGAIKLLGGKAHDRSPLSLIIMKSLAPANIKPES